ncbi:TNF receptor-associated factor 2-like [Rhipicephalus sanguineus]|uniref:TNF receptor-associated factor 2-like n=1 Tax=Rhipicephalus sanguineus TaxID=34632 RepID=UPI0018932B1C|nr:TNF receptor-associated factor 2-like [Rhipicephalus sanguineus]
MSCVTAAFQLCMATEEQACPIDGKRCPEEDVEWSDFPTEYLLKREVKCWNQEHGCELLMTASEVSKHFHRECEYHCTPCPRCSRMVLCRDMGEHLRSSCHALASPRTKECDGEISGAVETKLEQDIRRLGEEGGEIKAMLQRALTENRALDDSISDLCQNMNFLKESLRQDVANVGKIAQRVLDDIDTLRGAVKNEMAVAKNRNAEEFSRIQAAIKAARKNRRKSMNMMLEIQKKTLVYVEKNVTRCDFFVPGIESLEAKALVEGESEYVHGPIYLRGYNMSPGVDLLKDGETVSLGLSLELHKGDHDDAIEWPFEQSIRFTILHPSKKEDKTFILKTERDDKAFEKPTESDNWIGLFNDQVPLGHLKTAGYVCNDKLRVVLELL